MKHPLFKTAEKISGAHFSVCRKYRFALWRIWDDTKPTVMFIGLNPSTANEVENDPTIRRVIGMAKGWGYGGVYMMNCYPLVSTDPDRMMEFYKTNAHDVEDYENDRHLVAVSQLCEVVIFAWGAFKIVSETGKHSLLNHMFPAAKALIVNRDGSPRHPLYVPASVQPIKY